MISFLGTYKYVAWGLHMKIYVVRVGYWKISHWPHQLSHRFYTYFSFEVHTKIMPRTSISWKSVWIYLKSQIRFWNCTFIHFWTKILNIAHSGTDVRPWAKKVQWKFVAPLLPWRYFPFICFSLLVHHNGGQSVLNSHLISNKDRFT